MLYSSQTVTDKTIKRRPLQDLSSCHQQQTEARRDFDMDDPDLDDTTSATD